MSPNRQELEEQREWRKSEYVISFPYTGDRGRMRGSNYHAPGTLHRPFCRYLTVSRRVVASQPADVFTETLASWEESVKKSGWHTDFTVCSACCDDLIGVLPETRNGKPYDHRTARINAKADKARNRELVDAAVAALRELNASAADLPRGVRSTVTSAIWSLEDWSAKLPVAKVTQESQDSAHETL